MRMIWDKKENEDRLIEAVKNNDSISAVCRELGLVPKGGNLATVRKHIVRLNLNIDHHKGQAWNRGLYSKPNPRRASQTLKSYLLREYGHKCWSCRLSEWQGQNIPLELDHIDGNRFNNDLPNLRILCCNCHALTPTFRNKKREEA